MTKIHAVVDAINLPKHISHHLIGENHTIRHRRTVGVFVMLAGVALNKLLLGTGLPWIEVPSETISFAIHGMGLIPFAETK